MQDKWQALKSIDIKRFYTAGVLLLVVIAVGVMHSFWVLWAFLGIVYAGALYEATKLYMGRISSLSLLLGATLWAFALLTLFSPLFAFLALFFLLMCLASFQGFTKKGEIIYILPLLYPSVSFLLLLATYQQFGIASLFLLIAIVGCSDIFALLGGKLFGAHPLSPSSPGKTIEGALIGIGVATLVGGLFAYIWWVEVRLWQAIVLALLCAVASVFGDLYESALKRAAGVKDSGTLLPGHGGVLDRVDGYLFAIIVVYPLFLWILA